VAATVAAELLASTDGATIAIDPIINAKINSFFIINLLDALFG